MQTDLVSVSVRYSTFVFTVCVWDPTMGIRRVIGMVVRQVLCESDTHPVQIGHGTLERVDSYRHVCIFRAVMSRDAEVAQLLS